MRTVPVYRVLHNCKVRTFCHINVQYVKVVPRVLVLSYLPFDSHCIGVPAIGKAGT